MYFTHVRKLPTGTSFSALQATVQAWQPMHLEWSMTKPSCNEWLPNRAAILPRLWQNRRVMAPSLARFILMGAAVAVLVACFARGPVPTLLGALATALFPPALLLLAERKESRAAVWIGLLALSLVCGLLIALFWHDSPAVAGLPLATWMTWLFAGLLPFLLIVFGWVVRRPEP